MCYTHFTRFLVAPYPDPLDDHWGLPAVNSPRWRARAGPIRVLDWLTHYAHSEPRGGGGALAHMENMYLLPASLHGCPPICPMLPSTHCDPWGPMQDFDVLQNHLCKRLKVTFFAIIFFFLIFIYGSWNYNAKISSICFHQCKAMELFTAKYNSF